MSDISIRKRQARKKSKRLQIVRKIRDRAQKKRKNEMLA
jgi:hypothetical protein